MSEPSENGDYRKTLKSLAAYSHLGITFAAAILIFLFAGRYLDRKIGSEPYLTLLGAFLGAGGGFYYIIKELTQKSGDSEKD